MPRPDRSAPRIRYPSTTRRLIDRAHTCGPPPADSHSNPCNPFTATDFTRLLVSPFYPDEREQYFSNSPGFGLLGDRLQAPTIAMAAAWRALHWLHLGAGLSFGTTATSANQAFMPDAAHQEQIYDNVGLEVKTKLVPHFGLAVEATPALVFSGTFHLPYRNETGGVNELQLWNYAYSDGQTAISQPLTSHAGVLPWRAALAASYEGKLRGGDRWRIGATALYASWSGYTDRHGESPLDRWFDTLSGTLGGTIDIGRQANHDVRTVCRPTTGGNQRATVQPQPDASGRLPPSVNRLPLDSPW